MGLLSRLLSRSSKPVSEAEYQVKRYKKRQALIGRITKTVPLIVFVLISFFPSFLEMALENDRRRGLISPLLLSLPFYTSLPHPEQPCWSLDTRGFCYCRLKSWAGRPSSTRTPFSRDRFVFLFSSSHFILKLTRLLFTGYRPLRLGLRSHRRSVSGSARSSRCSERFLQRVRPSFLSCVLSFPSFACFSEFGRPS